MGDSIEENEELAEILRRLDRLTKEETAVLRPYVEAKFSALSQAEPSPGPSVYRNPSQELDVWDGIGEAPSWFVACKEDGVSTGDLVNPAWLVWRDSQEGGPSKYEDPDDPFNVWDGKEYAGKIPARAKWLREYEAEGRDRDEFLNPRWLAREARRRRRKVKYRDPKRRTRVWSGIGSQPAWIATLLEEGYTLEDLRVDAGEGQ